MKKIKTIVFIMGLFLTIISSGQQLTFRISNPTIEYYAPSYYLYFEIQVKASEVGSYFGTGQGILNFNNSCLSTSIADWTVNKGDIVSGSYTTAGPGGSEVIKYSDPIVNMGGGGIEPYRFSFSFHDNNTIADYEPSHYNEVTTNFQSFAKVWALITDESGMAGVHMIESEMNNQQSYKNLSEEGYLYYFDPNIYENDASNLYLQRIYANSTWSQYDGAVDWTASVNTSVWDGSAIIPGSSEALASNLSVHNDATLTIPFDGKLTVAGTTDIESDTSLIIESSSLGTGSLITTAATGSGTSQVQRYIPPNEWHLISSSVSGQSISSFLIQHTNIPSKNEPAVRGMIDYSETLKGWNDMFTDAITGEMGGGKGFVLRVEEGIVTFSGALQAGTMQAPVTNTDDYGWNLVGNPYSSAIAINAAAGTSNFIGNNSANLDPSFGAIYVWDVLLDPPAYTIINLGDEEFYAVSGQGFFVKAKTGVTNIDFTQALQVHKHSAVLKSQNNYWTEIKLSAKMGDESSLTEIRFGENMSEGLDFGYDAGIFKSGFDLYSNLVYDNGVDFARQCLPLSSLEKTEISLGLDIENEGEITFSAESFNLPVDYSVILEDRISNKFTDFGLNEVYSCQLSSEETSDRFYLHVYNGLTSSANDLHSKDWNVYSVDGYIRISGQAERIIATLYDIAGRKVKVERFEDLSMRSIETAGLKNGIYLLNIRWQGGTYSHKIPINNSIR